MAVRRRPGRIAGGSPDPDGRRRPGRRFDDVSVAPRPRLPPGPPGEVARVPTATNRPSCSPRERCRRRGADVRFVTGDVAELLLPAIRGEPPAAVTSGWSAVGTLPGSSSMPGCWTRSGCQWRRSLRGGRLYRNVGFRTAPTDLGEAYGRFARRSTRWTGICQQGPAAERRRVRPALRVLGDDLLDRAGRVRH